MFYINAIIKILLKYLTCIAIFGHLLLLQACLLLPDPPNLIISLQAVQIPQSGCWQVSHTPHLCLLGPYNNILYIVYIHITLFIIRILITYRYFFVIICSYLIREKCFKHIID